VIDQTGKVAHKFIGPVTATALIAKVDSVLKAGGGKGVGTDSAPATTVPAKGAP
jgi:hypothetical protein